MKRREFSKNLVAVTAVVLSPLPRFRKASAATAAGATPVFSFANGFSQFRLGNAPIVGSGIQLMGVQGHNHAFAWYQTQQPPTAFTTQFTFQPGGLGTSVALSGFTFCIQNTVSPPGYPGYVGTSFTADANMCGYSGATNQTPPVDAIAIKFDAGSGDAGQTYPSGGLPSSTGMYFNQGPAVYPGSALGLCPFNDLNPYNINFYSGHAYQVTIVYDGSLLTMVILDTTTQAQARFAWPLNLANTTNPTGNYVGFTAGTAARGYFILSNWSYSTGYNPRVATPTFSPAPGQYSGTQSVTISYPAGSNCYYSTNGLLPTSSSTPYTGSITVSGNEVIQAVAIQNGSTNSLVQTGIYQINTPNVINFPGGFSAGSLINVGFAYLSGNAYRLSDATNSTSGAVWFPAPVTVSSFTTNFTLSFGPSGQGMCFVVQNNPQPYTSSTGNQPSWSGGPTVVGAAGNAQGYGGLDAYNARGTGLGFGILNSVAISFNQFGVGSDPINGIGLYTDGNAPNGSQLATGLDFGSGHSFSVSISYSGTTLSVRMTDTVTGTAFAHDFSIDIASTVGASTAYVGFTGGTGGAASIQAVQAWTYTTASGQAAAAVPSAPTNLSVK